MDAGYVGRINTAIYGLVQASFTFYTKIRMFLKQTLNFEEFLAEPCLMKKHGIVVGIYADDLLMIGNHQIMENFMNDVKK